MTQPRNTTRTTSVPRHAGAAVTALVGLGPVLSLWWLSTQVTSWGAANVAVAAWVLLFFWTPFAPFTFTAVALGDHRDRARMDGVGGFGRGVFMLPWLVLSPHSTARAATVVNLAGVALGAGYIITSM
jgi:hypothetical protein